MRQAAFQPRGAMTNGRKGAFNGIAGADVFPVLSGKVVKRQQRLAVFGQTIGGLIVLRPILGQEAVERLFGFSRAFGIPNFSEKYVLLSHRENLTPEGKRSLKLLLKANKRLNTTYLLREQFDQLWDYKSEP
jgi:predicted alpha/beta superfamily hydrolase